jgi:DNA-binding CsgD family transcriptional regulator
MKSSVDARLASWIEVLGDLLSQPLIRFPYVELITALESTFDVTGVAWNWADSPTSFGQELPPEKDALFPDDIWSLWNSGDVLERHGLLRWFMVTEDPTAQTLDRVPGAISKRSDKRFLQSILRRAGCESQLSMPYRLRGPFHRTFVLARSGPDFSEDDLTVARRLQPLLRSLDTQVQILSAWAPVPTLEQTIGGSTLTGRELAVLRLLAAGHTAQAIGRRLGSSPRTVEKHVQHIYRKLEVTDRMTAVRLATSLRLIEAPDSEEELARSHIPRLTPKEIE